MKKIIFSLLICLTLIITITNNAKSGKISSNCVLKGKKLYGKVKVVTSFPDFKVKIDNSFPDLKVKRVSAFPDSCGKWKFVDSFPDFKIQIVNAFEDFSIKYVDAFPGVN